MTSNDVVGQAPDRLRLRALLGRSLGLTVALGLSQLVTAVIYAVAARSTTPADFGTVAAIVGVTLSLSVLLDFGSNIHWIRQLSGGRAGDADFALRCAAKWRVTAVAAVALWLLLVLALDVSGGVAAGVAVLLAGTVIGQSGAVPLRAEERFGRVGISAVAGRVVGLVVVLVLATTTDLSGTLLPIGLGAVAFVECGLLLSAWSGDRMRLVVRDFVRSAPANPWLGSSWIGASSALVGLQSSDVAVAERAGGAAVAGEYAAVTRWTAAIGLLSTAASQVAMPRFARASSARHAMRELFSLSWLMIPALVVIAIVVAWAPALVELVLGSEYSDSAAVLRWLALGTIPALLNQPLMGLLQARHHERAGLTSVVVGVPLQLVLVAVLAPLNGAVGVAQAAMVSQVVILVLLAVATRRMVRE